MSTRYCYVCKRHIELPKKKDEADKAFRLSGHSSEKVKHSQRDFGRKQRDLAWQH